MKAVRLMKFVVLGIALLIAKSAVSQTSTFSKAYKPGNKLYVHALQGLSLRANADLKAKAIEVVPFGAEVEVMTDTQPKVSLTNSNITGSWVKVKHDANIGYMFDGFLSRLKSMDLPKGERYPHEFVDYLKSVFKVKSDIDKSSDPMYVDYRNIEFTNGVSYEAKSYEGGVSVNVNFPTKVITFQELYLMGRLAYPEFFEGKGCAYKAENMSCEIDDGLSSLELKRSGENYLMFFGLAD